MIWVPSVLTLAGLSLSAAGIARHAPVLLLLGLAFDVLDGATAREYNVVTKLGGAFDWHVDVCIAAALACAIHPVLLIALVPWMAYAHHSGIRVSGRALLTLIIAIAWGM